jgi:hypothetical protein
MKKTKPPVIPTANGKAELIVVSESLIDER